MQLLLQQDWWKGKPTPSLDFSDFPENSKLCAAKTLNYYLKVTKQWRFDETYSQLLLGNLNSLMPVVKSTFVNWAKTTLGNAGID